MTPTEFNKHDNIDREVIEISKDSLRLRLERCARYAVVPVEIGGYGGVALTLLSSAFLTESFHSVWNIPGETIRATFLFGGIASAARSIYQVWRWNQTKEEHTPEAIISSLSSEKAKPMVLIEAPKIILKKRRKTPTIISSTETQKAI